MLFHVQPGQSARDDDGQLNKTQIMSKNAKIRFFFLFAVDAPHIYLFSAHKTGFFAATFSLFSFSEITLSYNCRDSEFRLFSFFLFNSNGESSLKSHEEKMSP